MTTTAVEKLEGGVLAGFDIDPEAVLKALNLNPRDPNAQALVLVCEKYGLDPVLKHVVLIKGNVYVTRDGYLAVAHRSGMFDGMEVLEQGSDQTHHWAKVAVYRKDMGRPFTYIGRYPKQGGNREYGPEMAVKCAEVAALRRAFGVTGVGAADERWDVKEDDVRAVGELDQHVAGALPPVGVDTETGEVAEPEPESVAQTTRRREPPAEGTKAPEPKPAASKPSSDGASTVQRNVVRELAKLELGDAEAVALLKHAAGVDLVEELTPGGGNKVVAAIKAVRDGKLALSYDDEQRPSWSDAEVVQGELVNDGGAS